jgi:hypothetical protein
MHRLYTAPAGARQENLWVTCPVIHRHHPAACVKRRENNLSGTTMDKKFEQIGLNDIRHMSEQECEETLLYLRYYLNRLSPGGPSATYQGLIRQLEGRLQAPPPTGKATGGEKGTL